MKTLIQLILKMTGAAAAFVAVVSCTHTAHIRGSVALKHSQSEADICLGRNEVKAGDQVILYKNVCRQRMRGRDGADAPSCSKVKLGEGKILEVLDDHYSVMGVGPDVAFEEGSIVEKK